jgi:hypothetical protein
MTFGIPEDAIVTPWNGESFICAENEDGGFVFSADHDVAEVTFFGPMWEKKSEEDATIACLRFLDAEQHPLFSFEQSPEVTWRVGEEEFRETCTTRGLMLIVVYKSQA